MKIPADRLTVVTEPTSEPVSVEEAKRHLRIVTNDEDTLIQTYIVQARQIVEEINWRTLVSTTYDAYLERWPATGWQLPNPPISSVTSIKYTDTDGTENTLATTVYKLITAGGYGQIILKYNQQWPSDDLDVGYPIVIRYIAGYGAPGVVPQQFKAQVLLWVGQLFERREGVEFLQGGELKEIPGLAQLRHIGRAW